MKTEFDEIIEEVLHAEGGYVDDPDDKGGATNFGITQSSFSAYRGYDVTKDEVKEMTRDEAKECYKRDFWNPAKIEQFPPRLKHIYFEAMFGSKIMICVFVEIIKNHYTYICL